MKVVVVGAGSFGVWTAYFLQQAGHQVILVDRWGPGNSLSSSGGETRVIRTVYGADDIYVKMAIDSLKLWGDCQERWKEDLMKLTGCLWFCGVDKSYIQASKFNLEKSGVGLEEIPIPDAIKRWQLIDFDGVESVYLEPYAGFLRARYACGVVCKQFQNLGGEFLNRSIQDFCPDQSTDFLKLDNGQSLKADEYVFACGPWLKHLFPGDLGRTLQISRQEVYFFGVPKRVHGISCSEIPIWLDLSPPIYYGVPEADQRGFKVALDERGPEFDPDGDDRFPTPHLVERSRAFLKRRFPCFSDAPLLESRVCQYSNTVDGHFLLDRHEPSGVIIAGGGSGHGFKMGPAIGKMITGYIDEHKVFPELFSLKRLQDPVNLTTQFEHSE